MSLDCCFLTSPLLPPSALSRLPLSFCTQPLLLSFRVFSPILCYRSPVLSHTAFHTPPSATAPPTFVHPFFSRTLVSPSHTSYEPHGSSASPVWDLRRRWVMLTVCTEPEPVPTCVLSSTFLLKNSFPHLSLSILLSLHTTIPCTHSPRRRSHGCKAPWYSSITPFCDPRVFFRCPTYTLCLCVPFENPHAFFSALHLVPRL